MRKECPKCFKQHTARNRELCKQCSDSLSSNMSTASTSLNQSVITPSQNQFPQHQPNIATNGLQQQPQHQQYAQQPQQQQQQQFINGNDINNENMNSIISNSIPSFNLLNSSNSQQTYSMFGDGQTQMSTRSRTSVGHNLGTLNNNSSVTPLSAINVAQLTEIIQTCIQPVKAEIQEMKGLLTEKVTVLENKVNLLEKENGKLKENNSVLTGIVVNMQSSLNRMENVERSCNLIISRIPEGDMESDNGILNEDKAKVSHIIKKLDMENTDFCENIEVNRIGKINPGKDRFIKVKLPTTNIRNDILKKKAILKTLADPLNRIFIKKDLHPVYQKENERIYKKMTELKKDAANEGKEIKMVNGKLMVDEVEVDKNTFLA